MERKRGASEEYCDDACVLRRMVARSTPERRAHAGCRGAGVAASPGPGAASGGGVGPGGLAAATRLRVLGRPWWADPAASCASPVPECRAGSVGLAVLLLCFLGLLAAWPPGSAGKKYGGTTVPGDMSKRMHRPAFRQQEGAAGGRHTGSRARAGPATRTDSRHGNPTAGRWPSACARRAAPTSQETACSVA